ncbi:hypothetical protein ASD65_13165 [Microbacterium sp. Root61]|nr:hypothetical protein ASD65_13165 [Microbacterium sp. Root61]
MTQPLVELLSSALPVEWVRAVRTQDDEALADASADQQTARAAAAAAAVEGWLTPEWPRRYGGRELDADSAVHVRRTLARWRVGLVESAIGAGWLGPAILQFGNDDQRDRLLPRIARNEDLWCQLFSETEAGSDLASVRTTARRDGDSWVIDGGKIWTSRADLASWGLAVTRTDGSVRKHAGLTCFCIPMGAEGVEIRPIRQMTGDAEFFEVRLDGVRVPDSDRIGSEGQGWEIVRAVLAFERRAGSGAGAATPGSVVGRGVEQLLDRHLPTAGPWARTRLIDTWVEATLIGLNNERNAALAAAGRELLGRGSPVNKVLQAEHTKRLQALRMELGGLAAVAPGLEDEVAVRDQWAYLRAQPKTVAGGTSEVLRDQIAERGLGMPRSVDPSRRVAWDEFVSGAGRTEGATDVAPQ